MSGDRLIFAPRMAIDAPRCAASCGGSLPGYAALQFRHDGQRCALGRDSPCSPASARHFAGRAAASVLHAAGLQELVTNSLGEYETKAMQLAHDQG